MQFIFGILMMVVGLNWLQEAIAANKPAYPKKGLIDSMQDELSELDRMEEEIRREVENG